MKKLLLCAASIALLGSAAQAQTQTARQLDVLSNVPVGTVTDGVEVFDFFPTVGIFWDERCSKVDYVFNTNTGAQSQGGTIDPDTLADTIQVGLDRWNANPSSYIEMNITAREDLGSGTRSGFDFVNEITFITDPSFDSLASSPSSALRSDATFVAGADLDGDGDPDVFDPASEGRNTCGDIDNDGDIEFPAGDYKTGTIIDNDVQFSSTVTWELNPTNTGGADVDAVSTHEFGHSHGLNHSTLNQVADNDGRGSVMFPFIDTSDAASELMQRTLHTDDLAASAYIYQEGNGMSEAAQLQPGDIAFDKAYSIVSGEVTTVGGLPAAGTTSVQMTDLSGRIVSHTYTGPVGLFGRGAPQFIAPFSVEGSYSVPVPKNALYKAQIESLDGNPVAASRVSNAAFFATFLGLPPLAEESWSGSNENSNETRLAKAVPFFAGNNGKSGIDFRANEEFTLSTAGEIDFGGTGLVRGANAVKYLEKFDRENILGFLNAGVVPVSGVFGSNTFDASFVPTYDSAKLAVGVQFGSRVFITKTIRSEKNFIGQQGDYTPFEFASPEALASQIRAELNRNRRADLFLILEGTNLPTGPSGFPPNMIFIDVDAPAGSSFLAVNGGAIQPYNFGAFAVEMRFAFPPSAAE